MSALRTSFEVVIPFDTEEEANLAAQIISNNEEYPCIAVREVAE